jgi:hypothetical protein
MYVVELVLVTDYRCSLACTVFSSTFDAKYKKLVLPNEDHTLPCSFDRVLNA